MTAIVSDETTRPRAVRANGNHAPPAMRGRGASAARTAFAALACAACLFSGTAAHAVRADRDQPIQLDAGHVVFDDLKQTYALSGGVILTKGTLVLKAETAEVRIDPEGYQHAVAKARPGELASLRQKRDGLDQYIEGHGETIEYDGKKENARLINRATIKRLESNRIADEIHGALITYDSRNETYAAAGGPTSAGSGGRVRATIAPRKGGLPAAPATPAPGAAQPAQNGK